MNEGASPIHSPLAARRALWYRGTADAVYRNLGTLDRIAPEYVLILAGDHVYQMDYRDLLHCHQDANADVTVATLLWCTRRWTTSICTIMRGMQEGPSGTMGMSRVLVHRQRNEEHCKYRAIG